VIRDAKTAAGVAAPDITLNVAAPALPPAQIITVAVPAMLAGTLKLPVTLPLSLTWGCGTSVRVTVPIGELKSIVLTWVYAGNPVPVNVTVSPGTPCTGDNSIEAAVTVKVPTLLKLVTFGRVHPQALVGNGAPFSLTRTVWGPALRPVTRAVRLNLPLPETGAVNRAPPPIWTVTVPVIELLRALVVGIHPDPVIPNSVLFGPADGVRLIVGAATVQVPVLYTFMLSVAITVYVPGFSGGTTMVVTRAPLAGIVSVGVASRIGPVIGAQVPPNTTEANHAAPVWVNPEPWRVTVEPALALAGVKVSPSRPTVMRALA
jgi:hypothetical protein